MDRKLNFGLVGCGNIGKRHAEIISKVGKLVAVCDIVPKKVHFFSNQYNCNDYEELSEMLDKEDNLQIVVICTPNYLHAANSIASLKAGKHVLCEKPMALSKVDCKLMLETATKENKLLHIVKQNRYNPPIVYLRELIDQNKLGKIYSFSMQVFWNRNEAYYENNWRGKVSTDGGILFTQFSHFLDILIWFFGETKEIEVKSANFKHKGITEFDDTIVAVILFKSGVLGSVHFSTCSYITNREGSLSIIAEKGDIKIGGSYLNNIEYQNIENLEVPSFIEIIEPNDYGFYTGSMSNHEKVYECFLNALTAEDMLMDSLLESSYTIDLIENLHNKLK